MKRIIEVPLRREERGKEVVLVPEYKGSYVLKHIDEKRKVARIEIDESEVIINKMRELEQRIKRIEEKLGLK